MLTVHHLEKSRSHRILWLLEELELEYHIERYARDPDTLLAPARLRDIHPLGKAPILTDGDRTVPESGAIIEYILDEYGDGRLRPRVETAEFLRYRYWLHYAEGSAMSPLLLTIVFSELPRQGPWLAKPLLSAITKLVTKEYIAPQLKLHMDYWEHELSGHAYFAGDEFTAADIQMSIAVETALSRGLGASAEAYPELARFTEAIRARPAYQRASERGGDQAPL